MPKYIIYVRRSSDLLSWKQVASIPDQIQHCLEYAETQWFEIEPRPQDFSDFETEEERVREDSDPNLADRRIYQSVRNLFVVKESYTWETPGKRKKRNKIIQMIKKWKIHWIISYSPDRQARNMIEWWELIELADSGLVSLKYKTFHFENNASGRMMLGFWFVFSKQYSDKLWEDIGRWNEKKHTEWRALWDFKYWYIKNEKWFYEPDPETFDLVRTAFEMKIYDKKSDSYIAKRLQNKWLVRKTERRNIEIDAKKIGGWRKSEFYYWVHIRNWIAVDYRQPGLNEFFQPMITETEFQILENQLSAKKRNTPKTRKEKYEIITPFKPWLVVTEDGYRLSVYPPNPSRFEKKLKKLQEKDPLATLADVIESYQIKCKCSSDQSQYKWLEIWYDKIEDAINTLLWTVQITDEAYQYYLKTTRTRIQKRVNESKDQITKLNLRMIRLKSEKANYIDNNFWLRKDKDEEALYQRKKASFDAQISQTEQDIIAINQSDRNRERDIDTFLRLLQKAPELFKKATYLQKKAITSFFIEKIVITHDKKTQITLKKWLNKFFSDVQKKTEETKNVRRDPKQDWSTSNVNISTEKPVKNRIIDWLNKIVSDLVEMIGIEPMSERDRHDFLPLESLN